MDKKIGDLASAIGIADVISTLEIQLTELDRIGAAKAAARLDFAIQQLRADMNGRYDYESRKTSAGQTQAAAIVLDTPA